MKLKQKIAIRYIRAKFKILSSISKKKAAEQAFELFCTPQTRNTKALPPVFQTAEKLQLDFQRYSVAGYRWNKNAAQKALIVHGFESSAINFDHYIPALVAKGYEVLAFDAPAHGRSSGKQINALIYADLIKHIIRHYGPIQTYIAHSFGGLVTCLGLADISHDEPCKLVLIAPATETSTAIDQFFQLLAVTDATVKNEFEKIITRISGQPLSWFSISRSIRKINASILWVHDEDDKTTPLRDVYKIKDGGYDNICFLITKGLGHRRIYGDAEVSRRIMEFV